MIISPTCVRGNLIPSGGIMEERAKKKVSVAGGMAFAVLLVVYVIVSFAGQNIAAAIFGRTSAAFFAVSSCFSALAIAVAVVFFLSISGEKPMPLIGETKRGFAFVPVALLVAAGMFMGLGSVNGIIAGFFKSIGANVSEISVPLDSGWHLTVFVFVLAVLPAVAEELFFRGVILSALKNAGKAAAILFSALCFSLYHCSVSQLAYQFVYGAFLAWLAITANSIIPTILAHFINNFAVLMFEYFCIRIDFLNPFLIISGIAALAAAAAVLFFFGRGKEKGKREKGALKEFFTFGSVALVICAAITILNAAG